MMVGNPSLSLSCARAYTSATPPPPLLLLLLLYSWRHGRFLPLVYYIRSLSRISSRNERERREAGARTFDTSYNAGYVRRAARSSVPANNASVYIPMMSYTCDCACAHELSRGIIDDFLILHFRAAV